MLVLSRKLTEQIVIAEAVVITVVQIAGNRVSLGINAPRSMKVMRGELVKHKPFPSQSNPDSRHDDHRSAVHDEFLKHQDQITSARIPEAFENGCGASGKMSIAIELHPGESTGRVTTRLSRFAVNQGARRQGKDAA